MDLAWYDSIFVIDERILLLDLTGIDLHYTASKSFVFQLPQLVIFDTRQIHIF